MILILLFVFACECSDSTGSTPGNRYFRFGLLAWASYASRALDTTNLPIASSASGTLRIFFLNSDAFRKLAPTTQYCYRHIVNDYLVRDWGDAMTFGLGSEIVGVAGVALSQLTNVNPNLGQSYIIDSFMVVVFGGVGNLRGSPRPIYR
jgi:Branched-chain amino acid transport system / permease component